MINEVYQAFKDEAARQKEDGISSKVEVDGMSGFIFLNRFGSLHKLFLIFLAITCDIHFVLDFAKTKQM